MHLRCITNATTHSSLGPSDRPGKLPFLFAERWCKTEETSTPRTLAHYPRRPSMCRFKLYICPNLLSSNVQKQRRLLSRVGNGGISCPYSCACRVYCNPLRSIHSERSTCSRRGRFSNCSSSGLMASLTPTSLRCVHVRMLMCETAMSSSRIGVAT